MNSLLLVLKKIVFLGKTQGLQGDGSYCFQFVLRMSFEDYKFKEGLKLIYLCFFFLFQRFQGFYQGPFQSRLSGFTANVRIQLLFQLQSSILFSGV